MTEPRKSKPIEIKKLLETLRDVPPQDQDAVSRGRADFLESLETLPQPVSPAPFWRLNFRTNLAQIRFRTLTISILIVGIFLGGGAITVSAAQSSLPGDDLYSFKLWIEDLRLGLTNDDTRKLELHLEFASERLSELAALEAHGVSEIQDEFYLDFNQHIQDARQLLALEEDPDFEQELEHLLNEFEDRDHHESESEDPEDQPENGSSGSTEDEDQEEGGEPSDESIESQEAEDDLEEPESSSDLDEAEPSDDSETEQPEATETPEEDESPTETEDPDDEPDEPVETEEPDDDD